MDYLRRLTFQFWRLGLPLLCVLRNGTAKTFNRFPQFWVMDLRVEALKVCFRCAHVPPSLCWLLVVTAGALPRAGAVSLPAPTFPVAGLAGLHSDDR